MLNIRILTICALFGAIVCLPAAAQEIAADPLEDDELAEARFLLQAGRDDIIRDEIRFTEDEAAAFWPSYAAYRSDIKVVRDRQAELVTTYLRNYRKGAVTEEQAEQLVDDYLDIKRSLLKVQEQHLRHFRKALPPRKAARFYQLENKLDAELDAQLAHFMPLMDPV